MQALNKALLAVCSKNMTNNLGLKSVLTAQTRFSFAKKQGGAPAGAGKGGDKKPAPEKKPAGEKKVKCSYNF